MSCDGGVGIDRLEYLLGIPAIAISAVGDGSSGQVPLTTPEMAIVKSTKQSGFASSRSSRSGLTAGEIVADSGPFMGRTLRERLGGSQGNRTPHDRQRPDGGMRRDLRF